MNVFTFDAQLPRVVFGPGVLAQLPAEIERLGARKALVLSTPEQARDAQRVAEMLGWTWTMRRWGCSMPGTVRRQSLDALETRRDSC